MHLHIHSHHDRHHQFFGRRFAILAVVAGVITGSFVIGSDVARAADPPQTYFVAPGGSSDCSSATSACALDTALGLATTGDTIELASGVYLEDQDIEQGITIDGSTASTGQTRGMTAPVIRASDAGAPALSVESADTVTLSSLTIEPFHSEDPNQPGTSLTSQSGSSTYLDDVTASGIVNMSGTSTIEGSQVPYEVIGHDSTTIDTSSIGALRSQGTVGVTRSELVTAALIGGTLNIDSSTFSEDTDADTAIGGPGGVLTLTNSTIDGYAVGVALGQGGRITGSTIVADTAFDGGGGLTLGADILAAQTSCGSPEAITDLGGNVSSDTSCGLTDPSSDQDEGGLASSLLPLADNGGPVETMALKPWSAAVEAVTGKLSDGTRVCGTPDARGFTRPSAPCDAGAFETNPRLVTPTVQLKTSPISGSGLGAPLTLTTTVTGWAGPAGGTVRFTANGNQVSGCAAAGVTDGAASCTTSALPAGTYNLRAQYSGDTTYAAAADNIPSYVISRGSTTTAVSADAQSVSAVVSPVAPASGVPTGTVSFAAGSIQIGSAPLVNGTATLSVAGAGARRIAATYHGDHQFYGSSNSLAVVNPRIKATATSAYPKTSYGWYRAPVTVSFTCTAGTGAIVGGCPGPVTFSTDGANQSVSQTINATDGGVATVTVSPINIDLVAPNVSVGGVTAGQTYSSQQVLTCNGSDDLSGIATCVVTQTITPNGKRVNYVATARDEAGNVTTVHGFYNFTGTSWNPPPQT